MLYRMYVQSALSANHQHHYCLWKPTPLWCLEAVSLLSRDTIMRAVLQGMSVADIARTRRILPDTVESYIADAITAGYSYPWHRMAVSDSTLHQVLHYVSLRVQQQQQQGPSPTGAEQGCPSAAASPEAACSAAVATDQPVTVPTKQRRLPSSWHQQTAVANAERIPSTSVATVTSMLPDVSSAGQQTLASFVPQVAAAQTACTTAAASGSNNQLHACADEASTDTSSGTAQGEGCTALLDAVSQLLSKGIGIRGVKESLAVGTDPGPRYGSIRLALSHILRTNLLEVAKQPSSSVPPSLAASPTLPSKDCSNSDEVIVLD